VFESGASNKQKAKSSLGIPDLANHGYHANEHYDMAEDTVVSYSVCTVTVIKDFLYCIITKVKVFMKFFNKRIVGSFVESLYNKRKTNIRFLKDTVPSMSMNQEIKSSSKHTFTVLLLENYEIHDRFSGLVIIEINLGW
jgi:hypothetical protein